MDFSTISWKLTLNLRVPKFSGWAKAKVTFSVGASRKGNTQNKHSNKSRCLIEAHLVHIYLIEVISNAFIGIWVYMWFTNAFLSYELYDES